MPRAFRFECRSTIMHKHYTFIYVDIRICAHTSVLGSTVPVDHCVCSQGNRACSICLKHRSKSWDKLQIKTAILIFNLSLSCDPVKFGNSGKALHSMHQPFLLVLSAKPHVHLLCRCFRFADVSKSFCPCAEQRPWHLGDLQTHRPQTNRS